MNDLPTSFADIIDLWPSIAALSRDIDEVYENTRQWRLNDSIPGRAFAPIVRAALERARQDPRFSYVTHELLCGFAEAKHGERRGVSA